MTHYNTLFLKIALYACLLCSGQQAHAQGTYTMRHNGHVIVKAMPVTDTMYVIDPVTGNETIRFHTGSPKVLSIDGHDPYLVHKQNGIPPRYDTGINACTYLWNSLRGEIRAMRLANGYASLDLALFLDKRGRVVYHEFNGLRYRKMGERTGTVLNTTWLPGRLPSWLSFVPPMLPAQLNGKNAYSYTDTIARTHVLIWNGEVIVPAPTWDTLVNQGDTLITSLPTRDETCLGMAVDFPTPAQNYEQFTTTRKPCLLNGMPVYIPPGVQLAEPDANDKDTIENYLLKGLRPHIEALRLPAGRVMIVAGIVCDTMGRPAFILYRGMLHHSGGTHNRKRPTVVGGTAIAETINELLPGAPALKPLMQDGGPAPAYYSLALTLTIDASGHITGKLR